jgi:Rab-like protein 2
VFDVTRKVTYQHLSDWYGELRQYCENIPCILVANKIDVDYKVRTTRPHGMDPPHGVSLFGMIGEWRGGTICLSVRCESICMSTVVQVTKKSFKFASQYDLPFFFVSAADGTNVVQVGRAAHA